MQTIKTIPGQSLINLALQLYGNASAVWELLTLNDFTNQFVLPVEIDQEEIDLGYTLKEGTTVTYDETSPLVDASFLKRIHGAPNPNPKSKTEPQPYENRNGRIIADGIVDVPLLFDNIEAPFIYSLRKLKSNYTGAAVRVRRSTDNTELDIGFTSSYDFDTAAFSAFVGGGTGYVVKWYNQLGDGKDMYNTSASEQPKILLNHTTSGKAVVHFNVRRLFIAGTDTFNFLHNTKTYKIVGVLEFPNPQSIAVILSSNNGGALDPGAQLRQYDNVNYGQITSNGNSSQVFSQFVTNFFSGLTIMNVDSVADGTITYRANGVLKGTLVNTQPPPNANASTIMTIGKNNNNSAGGDIKMAELIFFDQSNQIINTQLETNQKKYYGIN